MFPEISRASEVLETVELSYAFSTAANSFALSWVKGCNNCNPPEMEKRATESLSVTRSRMYLIMPSRTCFKFANSVLCPSSTNAMIFRGKPFGVRDLGSVESAALGRLAVRQ